MSPIMIEKLEFGIQQILRKWYALKTAVDQGWGGRSSMEKAEWLETIVFQHVLQNGSDLYEDELAEYLEEILQNEFNVNLEDQSSMFIAKHILTLYKTLSCNDESVFCKLKQDVILSWSPTSGSYIEISEDDSEDDESEMGDDCDMEIENQNLNVSQSSGKKNSKYHVDEDGWTTVTKKH